MNRSQREKVRLEHQAAEIFLKAYQSQFRARVRQVHHNQPAQPDVSCLLDGKPLDLEIAHLYGSEQEAMQILGRELTARTRSALRQLLLETDMHQRLVKALNAILASKATKHYDSTRVWLVIRNAHASWGSHDFLSLQHYVSVPEKHPFEAIWLIGDLRGDTGLYPLYP